VTKIVSLAFVNLVMPKAAAKHEHLHNEPASQHRALELFKNYYWHFYIFETVSKVCGSSCFSLYTRVIITLIFEKMIYQIFVVKASFSLALSPAQMLPKSLIFTLVPWTAQ
jgi:hypothetical protein